MFIAQESTEQDTSKIGTEDSEGHSDENSLVENRKNADIMRRNEGQGALHHQCIDELALRIRETTQRQQNDDVKIKTNNEEARQPQTNSRSETPTSFVTVIEVKDSSVTCSSPSLPTSASLPTSPAAVSIMANTSIDETSNGDESIGKIEEICTTNTVQNIEVKRKIPPR